MDDFPDHVSSTSSTSQTVTPVKKRKLIKKRGVQFANDLSQQTPSINGHHTPVSHNGSPSQYLDNGSMHSSPAPRQVLEGLNGNGRMGMRQVLEPFVDDKLPPAVGILEKKDSKYSDDSDTIGYSDVDYNNKQRELKGASQITDAPSCQSPPESIHSGQHLQIQTVTPGSRIQRNTAPTPFQIQHFRDILSSQCHARPKVMLAVVLSLMMISTPFVTVILFFTWPVVLGALVFNKNLRNFASEIGNGFLVLVKSALGKHNEVPMVAEVLQN
ncbi:hypothetical protein HDU76_002795 [Blyttiomyces sp. JEL0837]|nr:hypothetical protein HDU76_002795 [Blyttiomyces sp. JEL0837]